MKDVTSASKESHAVAQGFAAQQVQSAAQMVVGLFTVERAVSAVSQAYREWGRTLEETGKKAKDTHEKLQQQMTRMGMLANLPGIEKWAAGQIAGRYGGATHATREQLTAGFVGAATGAPELGMAKHREIALAAGQMAAVLKTPEEVGSYGER
jgi:transposase